VSRTPEEVLMVRHILIGAAVGAVSGLLLGNLVLGLGLGSGLGVLLGFWRHGPRNKGD